MLILLVEDHDDTSRAMATLLRFSGHEVITAATGEAAEKLYRERCQPGNEPFHCVVIDLGLPDTTGQQLLRALLRHRPVSAIALTGSTAPQDIAECKAAGFHLHLPKPVDIEDLEAAIQSLTER